MKTEMIDNDHVLVTFIWSTEDGHCYDCGLPAAFYAPKRYSHEPRDPSPQNKLCAVCAANEAAGGEMIRRIDEEEFRR